MIGFLLDFYCSKAFDLCGMSGEGAKKRTREMEGERSNVCIHDVARWQEKKSEWISPDGDDMAGGWLNVYVCKE